MAFSCCTQWAFMGYTWGIFGILAGVIPGHSWGIYGIPFDPGANLTVIFNVGELLVVARELSRKSCNSVIICLLSRRSQEN